MEPEGYDDVARSLISGQIESNATEAGGFCDAILTPAAGTLTFPILQRLCGAGLVVSDKQVRDAMRQAFVRLKLVAEPGGAAALAAALFRKDQIEGDAVLCTISGGNVDVDMFERSLSFS